MTIKKGYGISVSKLNVNSLQLATAEANSDLTNNLSA